MTFPSKNDITGDKIQTKPTTKEYADNWDRIFGKEKRCKTGGACYVACPECKEPIKKETNNDREIQESK